MMGMMRAMVFRFRMRKIVLFVILLLLCGCSQGKKEYSKDTSYEENEICYSIEPTGIEIEYSINNVKTEKNEDGSYTILSEGLENTQDRVSLPFLTYTVALPPDTDVAAVDAVEAESKETRASADCTTDIVVRDFDGIKIAYINVYPFEYISSDNSYRCQERASIRIQLEKCPWNWSAVKNLERIQNTIDNPEMIDEYKSYMANEEK